MEDERQVELDCIAAIFPEIAFDADNSFCATIDLPVHPISPVKVVFPLSADGLLPTPPPSTSSGENGAPPGGNVNVESHNLSYLPSLRLRIVLPEGYPEESSPQFELSTTPAWLSRSYLDELQETGRQMWEEAGRSAIVYGYIDSLQQLAENAFGFSEEGKILEIPQELKISLLDFDITAVQEAFGKETFDCGVCLDPKKGTVCHRMVDCGHVFCVECLQSFYNNAIKEGDLTSVRCLAPNCAKKREEAQRSNKHRPKIHLSPTELLQIPLEPEVVTRYVKLKHKIALESDKNTVYCPRQWCQGAARSSKHRKPAGLEDDESDDEAENGKDEDGQETKVKDYQSGIDLLCVCEDCCFAFCSRCFQGWHGEFISCIPRNKTGELSEEDKASLEYMKMYSTPCPTCASPAQKTHGCNHMICFKCNTHFCYLCSAWLDPGNPYKHYNEDKTQCFGRLWELEHGDGEEAGYAHAPEHFDEDGVQILLEDEEEEIEEEELRPGDIPGLARGHAAHVRFLQAPPIVPEIEEPGDEDEEEEQPQGEVLEREGPLVLRLNHIPRAPHAVPAAPDPPPAVGNPNRRRGPGPQPRNQNHGQDNRRPAPGPGRNGRAPQRGRGGGGRGAQANHRNGVDQAPVGPDVQRQQDAAHQAWVQMFVQMALNDEEDQLDWDSGDEEDDAAWEIPVR